MNDSAKREVFLLFIPQTTVLVSFFNCPGMMANDGKIGRRKPNPRIKKKGVKVRYSK